MVPDVYRAPKTLIAHRVTGEIRCVPTDSATFMAKQQHTPWFLVCSEPEEVRAWTPPVKPADGGTFTPAEVQVRRTARSLSYVPPGRRGRFACPGAEEIEVTITHHVLGRRNAPRTPAAIAELETLIATELPHMGIVTIPFEPVDGWGGRTMRRFIGVMAGRVPHGPHAAADLYVQTYEVRTEPVHSVVNVSAGDFSVQLRIAKGACPAKFWWNFSGTLAQLDAVIRRDAQAAEMKRRAAAEDAEDGDLDDNDLSWIERLARQHLHGRRDDDRP